eukprot:PhF_6_TR7217/c0_g1_i1/m.10784
MLARTLCLLKNPPRNKIVWKGVRKLQNNGTLDTTPTLAYGANNEVSEVIGHEREAFENFVVYKYSYANTQAIMYTQNLHDLPPKERLEAVLDQMQILWEKRTKDLMTRAQKLRLASAALACFEDISKVHGLTLQQMGPDYVQRFSDVVQSVVLLSGHVAPYQPECIASLLHAASVCDVVGDPHLRGVCFEAAQSLLADVGEEEEERHVVDESNNGVVYDKPKQEVGRVDSSTSVSSVPSLE